MNSKKVLALMMGTIVASSGISQMAVQVYAHDGESSSSSYSYDDSESTSILDEEESNIGLIPMVNTTDVENLKKLTNFTSRRVNKLWKRGILEAENRSNLYVSKSNLVFEPTSDTEARLVCLDEESEFNGDIVVPKRVKIKDETYLVTSIGDSAFNDCNRLQLEELPESLEIIGDHAFEFCDILKLRALPTNLREIGNRAFAFCFDLNLITLPDSITRIGNGAFSHCRELELEKLSNNLEVIGEGTFEFCIRLNLRELPPNLREIGNNAFANCVRLQLGELPRNLEIIGENTFESCGRLNLRTLPPNLREIGNGAFYGCRNLELRGLPENLCKIGNDAFIDTIIKTITIPASVTELGDSAFDTYLIERINLAQGSRLTNADIERAYGEQLGRILNATRQGQGVPTKIELNDEDDGIENSSIRQWEFDEEYGGVAGILPCGHGEYLEGFDEVEYDCRQGNRIFICPRCGREYNI